MIFWDKGDIVIMLWFLLGFWICVISAQNSHQNTELFAGDRAYCRNSWVYSRNKSEQQLTENLYFRVLSVSKMQGFPEGWVPVQVTGMPIQINF